MFRLPYFGSVPKNSIATDPRLCFCRWTTLFIYAESLENRSYVSACRRVQNTASDVSQIKKTKSHHKLCFSDGIITNKWGNETAGYISLIVYSAGSHGIDFQCRGLLSIQSSDYCRLYDAEY